jgi:hypothetical protein
MKETIQLKLGGIMMDAFEFMSEVMDNLRELDSEEEIDVRTRQMISVIEQANLMAKNYLNAGIL